MADLPLSDDTAETALQRAAGGAANFAIEALLAALPEAVYATDADGLINFYNGAAAELWGTRPDIGKSTFCGS